MLSCYQCERITGLGCRPEHIVQNPNILPTLKVLIDKIHVKFWKKEKGYCLQACSSIVYNPQCIA